MSPLPHPRARSRPVDAELLRQCLRVARPQILRAVAWAVLRQCSFLALPWLLGLAVDSAVRHGDPARAAWYAAALVGVAVAEYAGMRGWQLWSNLAEAGAAAWLRTRLLRSVLENAGRPADPAAEGAVASGDLTTRASRDVETVVYWVHGLTTWVVIGTTVLVLVPSLARLDPALLLVAAATVPVLLLVNRFFPPLYGARSERLARAHARRSGTVEELLSAVLSLRGVGADRLMVARHHRHSAEVTRHTLRLGAVSSLWEATAFAVPQLAVVAGLLIGGPAAVDGRITVGQLTTFVLWMGTVSVAVSAVVNRLGDRTDARVAARRIAAVLDAGEATAREVASGAVDAGEVASGGGGSGRTAASPGPVAGAGSVQEGGGEGELVVRGLTVRRPGRAPLGPLDLTARPGEWIALTGPTGSGKSALLRAVAGLLLAADGTVTLGGRPLAELPPLAVGFVPEAPVLMRGTVTENLLLTGDHAPEALAAACRAAGLDLALAGRQDGTGTQVGERGRALSGGQRQLVALARALLHRSPVLLLDDTTSALDAATETEVLARLRAATAGQVVVFATHSPAVRALADREITLTAPRTEPVRV
ncbi:MULTISPECIES: ATP-binding cassette domain-containing protein [unclassified Streptomyces]|uniref:ATP-binding cassette domain-containing protein n=1 Tax=unclassified Streptomyces TaxID=2593676 RepID=UPI00382D051E